MRGRERRAEKREAPAPGAREAELPELRPKLSLGPRFQMAGSKACPTYLLSFQLDGNGGVGLLRSLEVGGHLVGDVARRLRLVEADRAHRRSVGMHELLGDVDPRADVLHQI